MIIFSYIHFPTKNMMSPFFVDGMEELLLYLHDSTLSIAILTNT